MTTGHDGLAFAGKRLPRARRSGTLTSATQWLGELRPLVVLAGILHVRPDKTTSSFAGPPPSEEKAIGAGALGLWLFVPLFAWADRHRTI